MHRSSLFYPAALLLLSSCEPANEQTGATETALRPVRYQTVAVLPSANARTFSGLAKAGRESNLSFRVAGTIRSIPVKIGDRLRPEQLIAELDPAKYQLETQQALASLSQAEAALRNARANFERVKGLYENNNVSKNELDSARATAESGEAQANSARRAVELARLNIAYTRLEAFEPCSVADILAEVNENVSPGQKIVLVTCGDQSEVEIAIPESMIALIRRDMDAEVSFSAIPGKTFNAKVTEVGIAAIAGSTYPVTVALVEAPAGFRSGLAAQVSFALDTGAGEWRFIVPAAAVGEDLSGRYVYTVGPGDEKGVGIIHRRPVTTGELTAAGLEIVEGVNEGDRVVTAGVNVVRDGLRVSIE